MHPDCHLHALNVIAGVITDKNQIILEHANALATKSGRL